MLDSSTRRNKAGMRGCQRYTCTCTRYIGRWFTAEDGGLGNFRAQISDVYVFSHFMGTETLEGTVSQISFFYV